MSRNSLTQSFRIAAVSIVIQISAVNAFSQQAVAPQSNEPSLQAERTLLDAARQNPGSFAEQHRVGEYYLQQNRLDLGIPYLQKAGELDPKNYDNGYDLSLAYLMSGDVVKASAQLREMTKQAETAELDGLLAEAEEKSRDYQSAAQDYYRAVKLQPSEDNIFDLGSFMLRHPAYEGFVDRALVFFRYGVQKYPTSAKLTVGLGVGLYAQNKYDDAIQALCAAVDLNPSDPKPFEFLGKVSRASPAYLPEIRSRLEKFVSLYPDNGPANYYYAMSLWRSSEESFLTGSVKIEEILQKAISAKPDYYEAHFQLGALYQNESRYQDAITEFNKAVSLRPDVNVAHYRLALMYSRTHQKQLADEQFAVLKELKQQDIEAEELEDHPASRAKKEPN